MRIKEALAYGYKLVGSQSESRILLSYATKFSQEYLIGHSLDFLAKETIDIFQQMLDRRVLKEPIAYILGYKEFYGRNFSVDRNVLIPRADSEVLIDAVIEDSSDYLSILELGAGSGCLILTLLLEIENARGLAVDISSSALKIAVKNMTEYNLEDRCTFLESNWFDDIKDTYDIIISNPPYISKNDKYLMADETLVYEPQNALYADNDGYQSYEKIASRIDDFLKPKGKIFLEIGINQEQEIERIFNFVGYSVSKQYKDLAGIVRVLKLEKQKM